ncbi:hypothetical protein HAHE_16820 [Haloferula helveola]|uniref:Haem-binding domain-containing protein n=1 Tax=Haloferula helveola TaxID=490095 RepID=A0ABM7RD81_9BACT|nr:hypothetical protein HAHE_16820 [Haloferula helveola]
MTSLSATTCLTGSLLCLTGTGLLAQSADPAALTMSQEIEYLLEDYCWKCHDSGTTKGDVRLDNLTEMPLGDRLELFNRMHEQTYLEHMPPEDEDDQPSAEERKKLIAWIAQDLKIHDAEKLSAKLKMPAYGNYVSHEKLFSGEHADLKPSTPDRRWLISEYIFNAKFQRILEVQTKVSRGKQRIDVVGSKKIRDVSLANPFLLPETVGVRYYANEDLTGGHLSAMLTNAQKVSEFITDVHVPKRGGRYLPAITEIMALEESHMATLASRREFLDHFVARICEEVHGDRHEALLPEFVPVKLKPLPTLKDGEKYKKAPMNVSTNMLKKLEADRLVYHTLSDPEFAHLSDDEFREFCERIWFYRGDHERTIQSRMALLREYVPEFREIAEKSGQKIKRVVYEPLEESEMEAIRAAILKHRVKGDHYSTLIEKCMTEWEQSFEQERIDAGPPTDSLLAELASQLSTLILEREPTGEETADYVALTKSYIEKLGRRKAVQKLIQTFFLSSEFAYRNEFGAGKPDEFGRRMLSPRDASYAIAYALTDQSPDEELVAAAREGRLSTREDYEREIRRMLARRDVHTLIDPVLEDKNWNENTTDLPIRELRFFREFFGYPKALKIFKDEKRFGGDRLDQSTNRLVSEADRLVEYILKQDRDVFGELVGTEKFYVYHDGDNERMREASEKIKRIYAYFKDTGWEDFGYPELEKHKEFLREEPMRSINPDNLKSGNRQGDGLKLFKKSLTSITARLDKGQKHAPPFDLYRGYGSDFMPGENVAKLWGYRKDDWDWSPDQPMKVANRKGMLTHPAWLVAHAFNTETDPVHRGKFVREKLLAGTIPDVPITVDAQIPEDHNATLRARLVSATENKNCWHCHERMNPLGYTFEMYDDFGRYRTEEFLEYPEHLVEKRPDKPKDRDHLLDLRDLYKTLPVDSTGHLDGTGDESLDGDLKGAVDLADRLSKSRRVRQSFIRHAFRYFMGRNETLSDSKTLIDAEKAYDQSGGSFDEVVVSLLTSDSFIYRKAKDHETDDQ